MASMFGVIVSGRLVQTNLTLVSETKFITEIVDADSVNHVVVFMTGLAAFPEGMGAAVHFCWPETGWSLLGFITNEKPSAIFKISGLKAGTVQDHPFAAHPTHIAQIGISVERLDELIQQTPASNTTPTNVTSYTEFATRMVEHFFNFVTSFAVTQSQMTPQPNETFIPFKAVEQWYTNTKHKLETNPNWWKN